MKLKWFLVVTLAILAVGAIFSITTINNRKISDVDIIAVNDIVKTAEKNWGHLQDEIFRSSNQSFTIVDASENILYETPNSHFNNMYDSIKNRDTIIDLKRQDEIVGKVIIRNDEQQIIQQMKRELLTIVSLVFGLFIMVSMFYTAYIYHTLLKPFQQLQTFAANVARGNLDIPLTMGKNNYFGAFTESFDLLREQLGIARQREYESNRSKKELVATLSHDIKTPVASIKAVSELMLLQAKDEKVKAQLNTIYSKAEQIDLLVTDMFHATLEELEQLTLNVAEYSSEMLAEMIENVNYNKQIEYEQMQSCIVLMDPLRMQQVIDNVISNAYKYAGTNITITSQIHEGYLELHVMDYGCGVSEQQLPLLFNKYYRGGNVGANNGSGLGLYISKYFMENMYGQISCSNREDGFTVMLKIKLA